MALGAVLCLFLMLSGYAIAFPRNRLAGLGVSRGTCAPRYTDGCCNGSDTECLIRGPRSCYCDRGCHERDECCDDIEDIGCHAQCTNAGLHPGECRLQIFPTLVTSCRARPHKCYCDRACNESYNCDCCDDVPNGCYLSSSTSKIQDRPINRYTEINDALNDAERRLLHSLISSQNYQRGPLRLPIAQSEDVDDAEMLERRLLQYLTSSQSYRRRSDRLSMTQEDQEVQLLERALAEWAREYTSKRKN